MESSTAPTDADSLYPRLIQARVREALADTPAVLVSGPRQSGKTTLVKQLAADGRTYLTLDHAPTLLAAREDPVGLVRTLDRAVIDEVQRAPQLLLAIKQSIDEDRRPGRFLLTGSANLMTLPAISDSLAGRIEVHALLPLAQCEMDDSPGDAAAWLDGVFACGIPVCSDAECTVGAALIERVLRGGFPEAVRRSTQGRRQAWARQYLDTLLQRDVREIAQVDKFDHLPRLLAALAQVSGQLCNLSQLGGQVGLDHKTVGKYLAVFEQMYLLQRVLPWSSNRLSQLIKTPKVQFLDSGLLAALREVGALSFARDRAAVGTLLESFVFAELVKQCTWSQRRYLLSFYRDKTQIEVDFLLEDAQGGIVAIEVKAAATIQASDRSGLAKVAALAGERFRSGILLYDGRETLPLGPRLWAVPISTLWRCSLRDGGSPPCP